MSFFFGNESKSRRNPLAVMKYSDNTNNTPVHGRGLAQFHATLEIDVDSKGSRNQVNRRNGIVVQSRYNSEQTTQENITIDLTEYASIGGELRRVLNSPDNYDQVLPALKNLFGLQQSRKKAVPVIFTNGLPKTTNVSDVEVFAIIFPLRQYIRAGHPFVLDGMFLESKLETLKAEHWIMVKLQKNPYLTDGVHFYVCSIKLRREGEKLANYSKLADGTALNANLKFNQSNRRGTSVVKSYSSSYSSSQKSNPQAISYPRRVNPSIRDHRYLHGTPLSNNNKTRQMLEMGWNNRMENEIESDNAGSGSGSESGSGSSSESSDSASSYAEARSLSEASDLDTVAQSSDTNTEYIKDANIFQNKNQTIWHKI